MSCSFLLSELVAKESYSDFKWFPHKYSLLFFFLKKKRNLNHNLQNANTNLSASSDPSDACANVMRTCSATTERAIHIGSEAHYWQSSGDSTPWVSEVRKHSQAYAWKKKKSPVTTASTFNYNVLKVTILFCHPTRCLKNEIAAFCF